MREDKEMRGKIGCREREGRKRERESVQVREWQSELSGLSAFHALFCHLHHRRSQALGSTAGYGLDLFKSYISNGNGPDKKLHA